MLYLGGYFADGFPDGADLGVGGGRGGRGVLPGWVFC